MKPDQILKLSEEFYLLTKDADVKGNMAKRIMFSLLSHLAPQTQVQLTKGMVDIKALKQMIPGAKELLEYGTKASLDEAGHFLSDQESERLNQAFDNKEYQKILENLSQLFQSGGLQDRGMLGGAAWAKITKALLQVNESLNQYQTAKKNYDYQGEADALMEMTSYLNLLDGLAHNTGGLMDKIISYERTGDPEYKKQVERLMDAKELKDPEGVLQEILPVLEQSDAPLTMKDWVSAARQRKHQYDPSLHSAREEELRLIRLKKLLMQSLATQGLPEIKSVITSWRNLADNVLLRRAVLNKHLFKILFYLGSNVVKLKDVSLQLRHKIIQKLVSVRTLASMADLVHDQMTQRLESLGYPAVRKLLWDAMELIGLLEQVPESVGIK